MPIDGSPRDGFDGFWHRGMSPPLREQNSWLEQLWFKTQKYLGLGSADDNRGNIVNNGDHGNHRQHGKHRKRRASITKIWVNCTAFRSNPNPRAYTGYFESSSTMLNRIWYAGAYTLQLSTLNPAEGSALIDYNRPWDGNKSPTGSWDQFYNRQRQCCYD